MADNVLFEDQETNSGLSSPGDGDPLDAANFGALAYSPNVVGAITSGFAFTPAFGTPSLDIAAGEAKVAAGSTGTPNDGTRRRTMYDVEADARTGISLTDSATNHVYLVVDNANDDDISIVVNTTGSDPSGPSLKLGEVDTSGDTYTDQWHLRTETGVLSYPDQTVASSIAGDLANGSIVYARSEGTHHVVTGGSLTQFLNQGGPLTAALNADGNDINNIGTANVNDAIDNEGGDYNEAVETHATASGTVTIDLSAGNVHRVEAVGNVTLEVSNVTTTPPGNSVLIKLIDDDDMGPYTISWGTSWNTILWDGGTVRDEIPGTGNLRVSLETDDAGTNWWAIRSGRNFA